MANQGERYAQISETLVDHPKTTRLSRALRINRIQVIGHLTCLWNWAMKIAPDGDISRVSYRDIADAARYTDADDFEEDADIAAEKFVRALIDCRTHEDGAGFLEVVDGDLMIHDWSEYGGKLNAKVSKNAFFSWVKRQREKGVTVSTTDESFAIWCQDRDALLSKCVADSGDTKTRQCRDSVATHGDLQSGAKRSKEETRVSPPGRDAREAPKRPSTESRPSPLPPDWSPTESLQAEMAQECPCVDLEAETRKFADHWRSTGERRADWQSTWRNWIRRAVKDYQVPPGRAPTRPVRPSLPEAIAHVNQTVHQLVTEGDGF